LAACWGGLPVLNGDSGGGLWFEGELVGNTWATLVTDSAAETAAADHQAQTSMTGFTDRSFAAILADF
jgi:hypothetical protein